MDGVKDGGLLDWPFLDEPIYRWFIFLIVVLLFMGAWNMLLGYMR